ncbi:MAG: 30S ribosomal protein S8 [Chloroflexota bacterium]
MINDPIADMLTRVRNAQMAGHRSVAIPHSRIKESIARILKDEGFIADIDVVPQKPQAELTVKLKYVGKQRERRPVIRGLKRVSRPGRRVFTSRDDIPWVESGMGIVVISTPKGVMTGQHARKSGVGGEILCQVW